MLRDLVLIRLCYLFGLWVVEGPLDGIPGAADKSVWKDDRTARAHTPKDGGGGRRVKRRAL